MNLSHELILQSVITTSDNIEIFISTIDLFGIRHRNGYYETFIDSETNSGIVERYWTREDAIAGHAKWVETAKKFSLTKIENKKEN